MKKVLIAVAMVAFLASCKKEYVCECTTAGITTSSNLGKQKKADAEEACDKGDQTIMGITTQCTAKEK